MLTVSVIFVQQKDGKEEHRQRKNDRERKREKEEEEQWQEIKKPFQSDNL